MACFRRVQGWDAEDAIAEYVGYAEPKARILDQAYIKEYDNTALASIANKVGAYNWNSTPRDMAVLNAVQTNGACNSKVISRDHAIRSIPTPPHQEENFYRGDVYNGEASI